MEGRARDTWRSSRAPGASRRSASLATYSSTSSSGRPRPPKAKARIGATAASSSWDCYEVQVLDSYENKTYPDGQAAALYGQYPPLVNASRPAGVWQVYDIAFEAPRFDADGQGRVARSGDGLLQRRPRAARVGAHRPDRSTRSGPPTKRTRTSCRSVSRTIRTRCGSGTSGCGSSSPSRPLPSRSGAGPSGRRSVEAALHDRVGQLEHHDGVDGVGCALVQAKQTARRRRV